MATPDLALNLMLRGGAVAVLVLLGALLLRARPRTAANWLGAAFALGTALSTLGDTPGIAGSDWRWPISGIAAANLAVFWLFTCALLDDAYRPRPWHALAWVGVAALGVVACWQPWAALRLGLTLLTVVFAGLSVVQAALAWREDLVEGRRRIRAAVVVAAGDYAALVALVALVSNPQAAFSSSLNAAGLAVLAGAVAWEVLALRPGALSAPPVPVGASWVAAPATVEPPPPMAEPEPMVDPLLVARLDRLMAVDRVYREPDLGIGALAERMSLPEHRLRRLINQGLGYRNFSAFLNGYRLADAKAALADPARAEMPIVAVAMAAGFKSLGPFNRAFKDSAGCTPSEYRRTRRDGVPAVTRLAEAETD